MALKKPVKPNLNELELPESKRRRGSFIVRIALKRVKLRQNRHALTAASWMVLALPVIQVVLLVGVLNAEPWMALLALEGLLIAWLAAGQIKRPHPESKLLGFGIALMNTFLLSIAGAFLGSHVFWVTGLLGILPVAYLVFTATGRGTVRRAWAAYVLPLVVLLVAGGVTRGALVLSESEEDPGARLTQLRVAELGLLVRGGNGTERALIGLRQAQAAFEAGEYARAFELAHGTLYDDAGELRGVPQSAIGEELLDSLLHIKAQAYYNHRWGKDEKIFVHIKNEPLDKELLRDETVRALWAW